MTPFDPRLPRRRHGPRIMAGMMALTIAAIAWRMTGEHPSSANASVESAAAIALQQAAFAQAEARPGLSAPAALEMRVGPGETLEGAVRRTGVAPGEAKSIVAALDEAMETVKIRAGLTFDAMISRPLDWRGPVQLVGLTLRTGPAQTITLSRTFDGALNVHTLEEKVRDDTSVSCSAITETVSSAAQSAGADIGLVAKLTDLFQHKIDFERDIQEGDRLCLIYDRRVSESGRTVGKGELRYAELDAKGATTRFYAFDKGDGSDIEFFDETGRNIKGLLLANPVANARVTSGFGTRRHPVLGYTRAHQGVDFGAGAGTPILAAGDGVVVQAGWNGGYGNWVRVRHANGYETGYGHASRIASGIRKGATVKQGQTIAYVGSTGMSTGPHLHYEIFVNGTRNDPLRIRKMMGGTTLAGGELSKFQAQREGLDRLLLAEVTKQRSGQLVLASAQLRTAKN